MYGESNSTNRHPSSQAGYGRNRVGCERAYGVAAIALVYSVEEHIRVIMVRLTFYGGAGEIGGNKILLEAEDTRVFLDFGMSYSSEDRFFEFPLLRPSSLDDLLKTGLLPRLSGLYKGGGLSATYSPDGTPGVCGDEECSEFDGVLLSHAHMDHYGYLGRLRSDIPVYLSPVTKKTIELRNEIREEWLTRIDTESLIPVERGVGFPLGSLNIRRFDVDHSVLGASAYLIRTEDKTIAYTGDFRFHGGAEDDSEEFLTVCKEAGVDILLCEGTRVGLLSQDQQQVESHALGSEAEVEDKCRHILSRERGLVIYDASPADMNRMKVICRIAQEYGRTPIFDSKKAYLLIYFNHPEAIDPGLPSVGEFKILLSRRRLHSSRYSKYGLPGDLFVESYTDYRQGHESRLLVAQRPREKEGDQELVSLADDAFVWGPLRDTILQNPGRYLLYTSSGPQTLLHFFPAEGSKVQGTYIYGKAEPFKEEMELSFERLENWMDLCGLELEYAHTSGHLYQSDVERFIGEVDPKVVIPIHTEQPDLFSPWASDVRVPRLGESLEIY